MKVILDANILISYLLAPGQSRTITQIVDICFITSSIELIAPRELLDEITENVQEKESLRTHILPEDLAELLNTLRIVATIPLSLRPFQLCLLIQTTIIYLPMH